MKSSDNNNPLSAEDLRRYGSDPAKFFRDNLASVEDRIARSCKRAGRNRESVRLLPITKTVPAHVLRYAHQVGIRSFGENKVQEANLKRAELADLDVTWSIVGHLQSNKAKYVARFAQEFHALDSLPLAKLLNARLEGENRFLDVYIQVNTSREESKFGMSPDALLSFIEAISGLKHLRPRGLMTLALFSSDLSKVRPCFELLRKLRDEAIVLNSAIAELSMGMSGDFEEAISEGASVVRVGEAIFGKRSTPDGYYWPASTG